MENRRPSKKFQPLIGCLGCIVVPILLYLGGFTWYWSRIHPHIPLAKAVRLAQNVTIGRLNSRQAREQAQNVMAERNYLFDQEWRRLTIENIARLQYNDVDPDNTAMLASFKATVNFHATPPRTTPDCTVTIQTSLGVYAEYCYSYVSATGELGSGDDWCIVGPEFRKWALAKLAMPPRPQRPPTLLASYVSDAVKLSIGRVDDQKLREQAQTAIAHGRDPDYVSWTWQIEQVASLPDETDPKTNRDMLASFKAAGDFHSTPPQIAPDCTVTIQMSHNSPEYCYGYVSATGELGIGHDWCIVTPEFRKWVLAKLAKHPRKKSVQKMDNLAHPASKP